MCKTLRQFLCVPISESLTHNMKRFSAFALPIMLLGVSPSGSCMCTSAEAFSIGRSVKLSMKQIKKKQKKRNKKNVLNLPKRGALLFAAKQNKKPNPKSQGPVLTGSRETERQSLSYRSCTHWIFDTRQFSVSELGFTVHAGNSRFLFEP